MVNSLIHTYELSSAALHLGDLGLLQNARVRRGGFQPHEGQKQETGNGNEGTQNEERRGVAAESRVKKADECRPDDPTELADG